MKLTPFVFRALSELTDRKKLCMNSFDPNETYPAYTLQLQWNQWYRFDADVFLIMLFLCVYICDIKESRTELSPVWRIQLTSKAAIHIRMFYNPKTPFHMVFFPANIIPFFELNLSYFAEKWTFLHPKEHSAPL